MDSRAGTTRAAGGSGLVLGVDFGGSKIAVALCALDGRVLAKGIAATDPSAGALPNLELATSLAKRFLGQAREPLAAVGACTFGIPLDDGVFLSPAIPGWDELPLRRCLEDAFDVPVALETDVKAAAGAELRRGALMGADPGLYLNLGTGLAVAIVHGGAVIRGHHGASGEIGYNLRSAADARRVPPVSILEDVASGMGLASAVARLDPALDGTNESSGDGSDRVVSGAPDVFERASADPAYEMVLEEFLTELCFHVVNLAVAIDPQRIAVGGGMVRSWAVLEPPLRRALDAHVPYPPELVVGAFPFDAALQGAIDLGLDLAGARRLAGDRR